MVGPDSTSTPRNNNRNGNLIAFVSIGVAILAVAIAVFAMLGESGNAQILLLQEQQRIEKENRTSQILELRQRLERIEARSVTAIQELDVKLQQEITLVNAAILESIRNLDDVLQREVQVTKDGQAEDNIRERVDATKFVDFEARLRVLEDK